MQYIQKENLREDIHSTVLQERVGRTVQRFNISDDESFIFKKVEGEQVQKEIWVTENILPHTRMLYPKVMEHKGNCAVFEDLGEIQHPYDHTHLTDIVDVLSSLHNLPVDLVNKTFYSRFHSISDMLVLFNQNFSLFTEVFKDLNAVETFNNVSNLVLNECENIEPLQVISHGDFHIENICIKNDDLYVLDWELFCITDCYSDLFNLLDMTNPYFTWEISNEKRIEILKKYYDKKNINHITFEDFYSEYLLYAILYSFQFILYIENDRITNNYPIHLLDKQLLNIYRNINNCLLAYNKNNEYKKTLTI